MSPKEARVFVAEDHSGWQDLINDVLKIEGHRVVLAARDRAHALAAVGRLERLKINVALIDDNLNSYGGSGNYGQAILSAIRSQAPSVKTVVISGQSVAGADVNVSKKDIVRKLGKVVTKL